MVNEMEQIINQFQSPRGSQLRFLHVRVKASFQLEMSLKMSMGVQVNFLSGSSATEARVVEMGSAVVISRKFISSSSFSLQDFRKTAVSVLNDSKSKGWKKIGNISLELQPDVGGN